MADSILKIQKLAGSSNWDLWSIRMQAVLTEKGYLDIMINEPTVNNLADPQYISLTAKATAYIRLALADGPLLQTRSITNPYYLWGALKNLYETKGFSSEFLICKDLLNTKLSNTQSGIEDYLAKIKRLTDDLRAKNIILPDRFIAAYILNNLTKDYEGIVAIITQSIRSQNLINLEDISAQLIDESKRLKSKNISINKIQSSEDMDITLYTKNSTKNDSKNKHKSHKKCNYCGKKGHTEEECYSKHPELKKSNNKTNNSSNNSSKTDISNSTSSESEIGLVTILDNSVNSTFKNSSKRVEWVLDSGASIHIASKESYFKDLKPYSGNIKWGNTTNTLTATGIGTIEVFITSTGRKTTINNCLLVPEFKLNLLSIGLITERGFKIEFNKKGVNLITPNNQLLAKGILANNISTIETIIDTNNKPWTKDIILSTALEDPNLWHKRLGHIGQKAVYKLPDSIDNFKGLSSDNSIDKCTICPQAKITKSVSKKPIEKPENYLELVYSDIGGPIKPLTPNKNRYYITFLDAATKWLEVYLIAKKAEAVNKINAFINIEENNSSPNRVKRFHSDNAREYLIPDINKLCEAKGIKHTTSAPYSPEQNGSAERVNRTLFNKVRALLIQSNIASKYWGEALIASVYLYNRTPHSAIDYKTPFEARYNKKPDLSNIKIWGSLAYKREPIEALSKLDKRARPLYLIGYGSNQYKLLDPATSKFTWARDVKIIEGTFYKDNNNIEELDIEQEAIEGSIEDNSIDNSDNNQDNDYYNYISEEEEDISTPEAFYKQLLDASYQYADSTTSISSPNPGCYPSNATNQITLRGNINDKTSNIPIDPSNYKEAISSNKAIEWSKAMDIELKDLEQQNTWTLVPRPINRKVLKGRWVYKTKLNPDGTINKFKARWVVKGFLQQPGIDFFQTFAHTVKPIAFRLLFALAAYLNWEIYQWDVKSAFPNADIDTDLYVEQPTGYIKDPNLVCKLNKALYGLKQSARQWQIYWTSILAILGFKPIPADNSIFINKNKDVILATHIDDILVFSKTIEDINNLYNKLNKDLQISNLGEVKYYLGIEIIRDRQNRSIKLSQKGFIDNLLNKFNKTNLYPTKNPLAQGVKLTKNIDQASKEDIKEYQKQIGSLIYLTTATRADLAYPIGLLARFMSNPGLQHFKALSRVWQYLIYSKDYSLEYKYHSDSSIGLIGYSDSDWGGDISRKSTTGYTFLIANSFKKSYSNRTAISWNSKLQKTIALSSCESEYMALKEAIKESLYIKSLISQIPAINSTIKDTKVLYTDSQSSIDLANNPIYHSRTKHIDIQYHFVRENVINNVISLVYCPTSSLLADGLTKAIPTDKFNELVEGLGLKGLN